MKLEIKRVDRLVALSVLGSLIGVWLVLTGFDAVTQFLRQLGNIGKNGFTLTDATVYVLVTTPRRAYEMFGNAALIGGLLGLAAWPPPASSPRCAPPACRACASPLRPPA